jgi:predicted metal-dependent hydrolase
MASGYFVDRYARIIIQAMPTNFKIIITRSLRRTLALHILPDASLEVKVPLYVSTRHINEFIESHRDWIEERIKKMEQKRAREKTYTNGEKFMYLGKEYSLEIGNYPSIQVKEDKFLFPQAIAFRIKKELENWYVQQAKTIITARVAQYAEEMHASYTSVSFSDTKSKWGSCTSDNRLQFSWRLVMTPILVLSYVIVHELAHTKEKNHSYKFWNIVRGINPSYRQQIKWLKEHGNMLTV